MAVSPASTGHVRRLRHWAVIPPEHHLRRDPIWHPIVDVTTLSGSRCRWNSPRRLGVLPLGLRPIRLGHVRITIRSRHPVHVPVLPNHGPVPREVTLFDLTAGRRQEFPQRFLAGYRWFVHADAYDGYNAVHDNVRHLGCWMHARRYFVDAEPTDPRAVEALAFVRTLYGVERDIKVERERVGSTFTDADVVRVRQTRAGPTLAAFADWLEEHHRSATPKSLFGQAVG